MFGSDFPGFAAGSIGKLGLFLKLLEKNSFWTGCQPIFLTNLLIIRELPI
jgi:hypothetical protein